MAQPTFEMAAGGTHLIPQDPIVWPSDAKLRLVLGGPPDLLPTRVADAPLAATQISSGSNPDAPQK